MIALSNRQLEADPRRRSRIQSVDVARGVAVLAMVAYHTGWDLSELKLVAFEVTASPAWRFFARAIAASFLLLAGISLVLAHGDGIRRRAFARRLATVALGALAVTAVTLVVFPESYVFFGILHCIALASLLSLPFARWPAGFAAAGAIVAWLLPILPRPVILDADPLAFLGLGGGVPVTNDWVPLFPWAGFVLAGIALARSWRLPRFLPRIARRVSSGPTGSLPMGPLAWTGRHSLVIYLLHQPLIFGLIYGIVQVTGPNPEAMAAPFLRSCTASCVASAQPEATCRAACACTTDALRPSALWPRVVAGRLTPEEQESVGETARSCFRQTP